MPAPLILADVSAVAGALSQVEGGLESYTYMGEEARWGEACVSIYRWFYRQQRVWFSAFMVQCLEVKLMLIVVCPQNGRSVRTASFEKCGFGSMSSQDITRSDIDGEFSRLLGSAPPAPLSAH